jgi:2'-5' RNA ligase
MHLFGGVVLPRDVIAQVALLAAGVRAEPEPQPPVLPVEPGRHAASSRRRFGRRRGQEPAPAPPAPPVGPQLDLVHPARMYLPIAKFGSLALTDAARLVNAIEHQASDWQPLRLHLQGGVALEPEGDNSVWVRLRGDVDELNLIARSVSRVAQGLHLFVDRRAFRTEVRLGTVNRATTELYLERLLAALEAYESRSWRQTNISLLIPADVGPDQPPYTVHRDISIGPAAGQ